MEATVRQAECGDGFRLWRLANTGALVSPLFYASLLRLLAPTSVVAERDGSTVGFVIARLRAHEVIEILDVHCARGATTELVLEMLDGIIKLPAFRHARPIDVSRCPQQRIREAVGALMHVAPMWPARRVLRKGEPRHQAGQATAS